MEKSELIERIVKVIKDEKSDFSILEFNILADKFVKQFRYPFVEKEHFNWEHRKKLIGAEVQ